MSMPGMKYILLIDINKWIVDVESYVSKYLLLIWHVYQKENEHCSTFCFANIEKKTTKFYLGAISDIDAK